MILQLREIKTSGSSAL